ncbi:MAG: serine/threonine-protein kinase [Planctomycetota bacterium]
MSPVRLDQAFATQVVARGLLDAELVRRCLAEVEAQRARGGAGTLAELLLQRGLAPRAALEDAWREAVARLTAEDTRGDTRPDTAWEGAGGTPPPSPREDTPTRAQRPSGPPASGSRAAGPGSGAGVLHPGQVLCGCVIEEELGRGGMGAVYRARDPRGQEVALKVLLGTVDAARHERFLREAEALAGLSHPGVVRLLGAELAANPPCLVLELVRGRSLAELMRPGPPPLEQAVDLFAQTCAAVEAAHARGVVHRDLKPDNVLVTAEGQVKVVDFGVARALDRETRLTATGIMVGTPHYMSPEQARGEREIGPATDVYGLARFMQKEAPRKRGLFLHEAGYEDVVAGSGVVGPGDSV